MAAAESLVQRHELCVREMTRFQEEADETNVGPKWLLAHDRAWAWQQRAWAVEEKLMKLAETNDQVLGYLESYFDVRKEDA